MNSRIAHEISHFNELIIQLEHDLGTRDLCMLFMECMRRSVTLTKFKNKDELREQIMDFYEIFLHMKPRMAIIQNYLDHVVDALADYPDADTDALIKEIGKRIDQNLHDNKDRNKRLIAQGVKLIKDGSTVLIHSNSHSVMDVLVHAKKAGRDFKVIVAEQEAGLTLQMVHNLNTHCIAFTVVPEYLLTNVEDTIDFMLIGALTLKYDMQFMVHAGTNALVAETNAMRIPAYLLMTTNKFSYWKTKAAQQTLKTVKSVYHKGGGFHYERIKFSHDRLPVENVTKIVTEDGVLSVDECKAVYKEKLAAYKDQEKEIEGIEV